MSTARRRGRTTEKKLPNKISLYQQLISQVMEELVGRALGHIAKPLIDHRSLINTVSQPTKASQNQLH